MKAVSAETSHMQYIAPASPILCLRRLAEFLLRFKSYVKFINLFSPFSSPIPVPYQSELIPVQKADPSLRRQVAAKCKFSLKKKRRRNNTHAAGQGHPLTLGNLPLNLQNTG